MTTSWWLALAAVMVLALIAALIDGWARSGRRPGQGRRSKAGGARRRRKRRFSEDPPDE